MAGAADPSPSVPSSHSVMPPERTSSIGRGRRIVGRCLLALAICGIGFAAWSTKYKPQGWLEPLFAPEFDNSAPPRKPRPKPHEVYKFDNAAIPKEQIVFGGPDFDEIPSLTNPECLLAEYGTHVFPHDRVIGVAVGDNAKAYPIKILTYHEAVNDHVGQTPVLVTYCALSGSAAVFNRSFDGRELEFGISGMLFNSNTLLFSRTDDKVKSLWSQIKRQAVTGTLSGMKLVALPLEVTTWADWRSRHPQTTVLSKFAHRTNRPIQYQTNPAGDYFKDDQLWYPAEPSDDRLPKKTHLLAVWTDKAARAYPLTAFASWTRPRDLKQTLDGREFTLHYDPKTKSLRVADGEENVQQMYALWFAWYAFNPHTELYQPPANESASLH